MTEHRPLPRSDLDTRPGDPPVGFALKWQRTVFDHLEQARPPNQASLVALTAVLVTHADPDGSRCFPSRETMGRRAGLHPATVKTALDYLAAHGFIQHVGNRARGLREYRLTIPDQIAAHPRSEPAAQIADHARSDPAQIADHSRSAPTQIANQIADHSRSERSDRESDRESDRGSFARTSVDLRRPSSSSDDELEAIASEWAAAKTNGTNPAALKARILAEDRRALEAEAVRRRRARAVDECPRCDHRGFVLDEDGLPTMPTILCDHRPDETAGEDRCPRCGLHDGRHAAWCEGAAPIADQTPTRAPEGAPGPRRPR